MKTASQRSRILGLLRERGALGVTNIELNRICFRYGGRLFELRRQGFRIETVRDSDSVFRFVLRDEPARLEDVNLGRSHFCKRPATGLPLFDQAVLS